MEIMKKVRMRVSALADVGDILTNYVAVPAIRKMRTSEGCFVPTNEHLK